MGLDELKENIVSLPFMVLYGMFAVSIWIIPQSLGIDSYPLWQRIFLSVAMIPITAWILGVVKNK